MLSVEEKKPVQIPLQHILSATNGFAYQNLIGKGGFGNVYEGESEEYGRIAIKWLDRRIGQGDQQFKTEVNLLSKCRHENIVSLVGFCDENGEKILVYKHESKRSLDKHLNSKDLTWIQRLEICVDIARGLKYLHYDVGELHRILHRDVKSSNILLDEKWKPKISDFGLARVCPANAEFTFVYTNPCGTPGYVDPDYIVKNYLTQKSDVYSFGVVLWEVMCGMLAKVDKNGDVPLLQLAQRHYTSGTLQSIIPSYLHNQINTASLLTFSNVAYQCLKIPVERPTMTQVVDQLQQALHDQLKPKGKKTKEETEQAAAEEGEWSFSRPQEFVFLVFMHCDECARKVRQCLRGFEGVEDVKTDCENHKVVVKGEKADPLKVQERIRMKTRRKVELLSPEPIPLAKKAPKKTIPSKQEDKKDEDVNKPAPEKETKKPEKEEILDKTGEYVTPSPPQQEIVFRVFMHCQDCAKKIQKCLKDFEGVEGFVVDHKPCNVTVKGEKVDPLKILERIKKETLLEVELLSPLTKVSAKEGKKPSRKVRQPDAEGAVMGCETHKVGVKRTNEDPLKVPEITHQKVKSQYRVDPKKPMQKELHEQEDDITSRDGYFFVFVTIVCFFIIYLYLSTLVKLFKFKHY